jgi:glutathione S-transferase
MYDARMKLYGTTTSPFVRRVRIVAAELGVAFELHDTATPEGQAALRSLNPTWKVPTAAIDGRVVFDSHVIVDLLLRRRGHGPLRPVSSDPAAWAEEQNLMAAIDSALESAINVFYFVRDGIDVDGMPYLVKQGERVASILGWLETRLRGPWLTDDARLGLSEIMLITALEWLQFRQRYPVDAHPGFTSFLAAHADRPSIRATYPAQ